jgi:hypothetical protein
MLSVVTWPIMLSVIMPSVVSRYAECHYAECRYAECRYAECRYAVCRYSECRGAIKLAYKVLSGTNSQAYLASSSPTKKLFVASTQVAVDVDVPVGLVGLVVDASEKNKLRQENVANRKGERVKHGIVLKNI